jgi:hypothetical protein
VEGWFDDLAPHTMARYRELREAGWTCTDAMRDVLPRLATEDQLRRAGWRVSVAEPASPTDTAGYAQAPTYGLQGDTAHRPRPPDDSVTPSIDQRRGRAGLGRRAGLRPRPGKAHQTQLRR